MFLQPGPSHISIWEVQEYFCQEVRTTSTFVRGSLKVVLLLQLSPESIPSRKRRPVKQNQN